MSTRGSMALLASTVVIGLILAGCGGGGSDSSAEKGDSSASPSKAQFIKQADEICKEGGEQANSEFVAFAKESNIPEGKEPTTEQWEEIGTRILIPALRRQADEIGKLGSPAGDEAQIEAFLNGVDQAIEKLEESPETAKEPSKALADAHRTIKRYGFKVCGGGK